MLCNVMFLTCSAFPHSFEKWLTNCYFNHQKKIAITIKLNQNWEQYNLPNLKSVYLMYHSMSFVWGSYFLSLWTFWTHLIPLLLYNKIKGPFEGGTYVTSQHLVADLLPCTVRATSYPFLIILVNSKGVFSEIRLHNVHAT